MKNFPTPGRTIRMLKVKSIQSRVSSPARSQTVDLSIYCISPARRVRRLAPTTFQKKDWSNKQQRYYFGGWEEGSERVSNYRIYTIV